MGQHFSVQTVWKGVDAREYLGAVVKIVPVWPLHGVVRVKKVLGKASCTDSDMVDVKQVTATFINRVISKNAYFT